jgi:prefoldin subunit 5
MESLEEVAKLLKESRDNLEETIEQSKIADSYAEMLHSKIAMLEMEVHYFESKVDILEARKARAAKSESASEGEPDDSTDKSESR